MADCRWCDKTLPGDAIPACSSCLYRSRAEASKPKPTENEAGINFDISKLKEEPPKQRKGKTQHEVRYNLYTDTVFKEPLNPSKEIPMSTVRIKSRNLRNRNFLIGNSLVLTFDENGIAECREGDVYLIQEYSRVRPGRFTIVEEPKQAAPAPAPVPEEPEPEVEEEKVQDSKPQNEKKAEPKKKPVKKPAADKDSE